MGGFHCSESFRNDKKCMHALRLGLLLGINENKKLQVRQEERLRPPERCKSVSRRKQRREERLETHASEGDLRLSLEGFGEAAHEVEDLARATAAVEAAEVVECRSTAWPYPGPGWLRSRTWRVGGGVGRGSGFCEAVSRFMYRCLVPVFGR